MGYKTMLVGELIDELLMFNQDQEIVFTSDNYKQNFIEIQEFDGKVFIKLSEDTYYEN